MRFRLTVLALTFALAGPSGIRGDNVDPTGLPPYPETYTSIAAFGAKADGSDATAAIQAAIKKAATTRSKCVFVPAGNYVCGPLVLDGVKLVGNGPERSTLTTPDPANATIKLSGLASGIFNLKLYTPGKTRVPNQDRIQVMEKANVFYISNVIVDGSNAAGIIVYGGGNGRITSNRVLNTKADAIHMTGSAHNIYVAGNYVRNSGDDCIAAVTYDWKNPNPLDNRNILIENNDVGEQTLGRGISVIGGNHVTIRHNLISKTDMAGIYIVSETSYHTRGDSQIIVEGNKLDHTPYLRPMAGHPAILLYSDTQFTVSDVKIIDNIITNAPNGPFRIGPGTKNIFCFGNICDGKPVEVQNANGPDNGIVGATITGYFLHGTPIPLPGSSPAHPQASSRGQDSRSAPLNTD
jgi:parallel beta-helix repeat protein